MTTSQTGRPAASENGYERARSSGLSRDRFDGESPEALRRRADILLDEMMLGGVDLAAGEFVAHDAAKVSAEAWDSVPYDSEDRSLLTPPRLFDTQDDVGAHYENVNGLDSHHEPDGNGDGRTNGGPNPSPEEARQTDPPHLQQPGSAQPRPLVSAQERYAHVIDAGYFQESLSQPAGGTDVNGATAVRYRAQSVASMTVGLRTTGRSPLLPRSKDADLDACQQTINELTVEVNDAFPQGHEAAERSRHLLNKAENILQSDPTRTAEIDYYLQQVRRIVQRARQTQEWSDLYRRRLSLYSVAWLLLAGVVMAACLLLQIEFRYELQMLFLLDAGSPIVLFTPLVVATMAAGAFGATVSALLSMRRHVQKEYGYFDRKYGLRGLFLPIAGLFFGFLCGVVASSIYFITGIDSALILASMIAPMVVAALLGFGQERLFGVQ